jgi:hypothetical protein
MKRILFLLLILNTFITVAHSNSTLKVKKIIHIVDDKHNPKPFKKKNYIELKTRPTYSHITQEDNTEQEDNAILKKVGLTSYIKEMDSLDRKILLHRLSNYVPRKLISLYPKIPRTLLLHAQENL